VIDLLALVVLGTAAGTDILERRVTRLLFADAADLATRRRHDREESEDRQHRRERIETVLEGHAYPTMVFQPIVDLTHGRVVGYEALSRFGPMEAPPDAWFNEAADVGLGIELELKAVSRALDQLGDFPEPGQYLSVNCSPDLLISNDLYDLLKRHDAARVVVELTEHLPVDDYEDCRTAVERLRELGVRLAIDDMGTGYASMRHVIELRPEIIKLDRSLVKVSEGPARSMVQAMVTLAGLTGSTVLAEGIEDEATLSWVRELGAELGQGWHIGHPEPLPTHTPTRTQTPSSA
jgi:EAL domain-containing protein (putative c-di-GMP-specific phosphodiesterase class I)